MLNLVGFVIGSSDDDGLTSQQLLDSSPELDAVLYNENGRLALLFRNQADADAALAANQGWLAQSETVMLTSFALPLILADGLSLGDICASGAEISKFAKEK